MPQVATPLRRRRSGAAATLGLAVLLLTVAGCSSSPNGGNSTPGSSGAVPSISIPTASSVNSSTLKPVLTGLVDRLGEPPAQYIGVLDGWVVNVKWADLQPTAGGPIASNNAIDAGIAAVRQLNAAIPGLNLGLRIRTGAAATAPAWLQQQTGPTFAVHDVQGNITRQISKFWTPQYGQAHADFEAKLAAKYDTVPEVREIDVSRCGTIFDEVFLRQANDPATRQNLLTAGFTIPADEQCQEQSVDEMSVWKHTHVDMSFNSYQVITSASGFTTDLSLTEQFMEYCRAVLGQRCVLFNESIRSPISRLGPEYEQMYAKMKQLGAPIGLQTATAARVGDLSATIQLSLDDGAECVEVPSQPPGPGVPPNMPSAPATDFVGWNAKLAANAPPALTAVQTSSP